MTAVVAEARAPKCAIYTRKSSEEGLDQSFNSLHAQREACEAYVRSQAGEGWVLRPAHYDDGGYSGGTMERPALQALLADIAQGRVDIVVVYKVDRLTRSLSDFAKIVDIFDAAGTSFVSVTQAFNTTTSMGRLTLNVLLSFAQFEREVTGERIRDKIAASKAKGIWMGGVVPLGYRAEARALVVDEAEAEQVREIYRRYLDLGSVTALKAELHRQSIRWPERLSRRGRRHDGAEFSTGALFHLLQNRLYIGEIVHKGLAHPGRHAPIVDRELFERVQVRLERNRQARSTRPTRAAKSPLTGRIFDASGGRMSPTFGYGSNARLYRYYASAAVLPGRGDPAAAPKTGRRVSAPALESLVIDRLRRLAEREELAWPDAGRLVQRVQLRADAIEVVVAWSALSRFDHDRRPSLAELQERLSEGDQLLPEGDGAGAVVRLTIPVRPIFRGGRASLQAAIGAPSPRRKTNAALIRGLCNAHQTLAALSASPLAPLEQMSQAAAPSDFYARRTMPLAYLAPDIQRAILQGRQPSQLTLQTILDAGVPASWAEQRRRFGFEAAEG